MTRRKKKTGTAVAVGQTQSMMAQSTYLQGISAFVAEKQKGFAPPEHTIAYRMWKAGRLSYSMCRAVNQVYEDAIRSRGRSKGLVSSYNARIDQSGHVSELLAYSNAAWERLNSLGRHLHHHERQLLVSLMRDYYGGTANSRLELDVLGAVTSGYTAEKCAVAAGSAIIQALLRSVAEFYGFKDGDRRGGRRVGKR